MHRTFAAMLATLLLAAPLAFASHLPVGAPRTNCEPLAGAKSHEYVTGLGFAMLGGEPSHTAFPAGVIIHPTTFAPNTRTALGNALADGSIPPCAFGDGTWDGHLEFGYGGAWLFARSGTGAPSNGGTLPCWGAPADHSSMPTISVFDHVIDVVLGTGTSFSVYADTYNNLSVIDFNTANCGDFESDLGVDCVTLCFIGFPPGLDGTYQVYVAGFSGVITST